MTRRLEKDVKVPSDRYWVPILRAIRGNGGSARVCDLYSLVEDQLSDVLGHADFEDVPNETRPEPRWKNTMRVARDEMVKAGLLLNVAQAGRGNWEITWKGNDYLDQWAKQTSASDVWPPTK